MKYPALKNVSAVDLNYNSESSKPSRVLMQALKDGEKLFGAGVFASWAYLCEMQFLHIYLLLPYMFIGRSTPVEPSPNDDRITQTTGSSGDILDILHRLREYVTLMLITGKSHLFHLLLQI